MVVFCGCTEDALCFQSDPENVNREDVQLLHEIMSLENELMHRYLYYTILFSEHQDLSQRLFKNSIDHMRNWDKNSGILIKLGDVVRIENAERDAEGVEKSTNPMPSVYPGNDRMSALDTLIPAEEKLTSAYETLIAMIPDKEIKEQLEKHLGRDREHVFTQQWLLKTAQKITGLK